MADMQEVKAAIGKNNALALLLKPPDNNLKRGYFLYLF
jgi:hypothetical protein